MMDKHIFFVSGLSGSGKTSLCTEYVKKHPECSYIDLDWFYKDIKPKVKLSNGKIVSNWDCPEALDWEEFNFIVSKSPYDKVLISGFAPLVDRFDFKMEKHIYLSYGSDMVEKCIQARLKSKNFSTSEAKERDRLMVKEVILPFHKDVMEKYPPDDIIEVFTNGKRKAIKKLIKELEKYIR